MAQPRQQGSRWETFILTSSIKVFTGISLVVKMLGISLSLGFSWEKYLSPLWPVMGKMLLYSLRLPLGLHYSPQIDSCFLPRPPVLRSSLVTANMLPLAFETAIWLLFLIAIAEQLLLSLQLLIDSCFVVYHNMLLSVLSTDVWHLFSIQQPNNSHNYLAIPFFVRDHGFLHDCR